MKKYLLAAVAMSAVCVPAFAQSYSSYRTAGDYFVSKGLATSATTSTPVGVDPTNRLRPVHVYGKGSVAVSGTVTLELNDGSILSTLGTFAIGANGNEIVSFSAPVGGEAVRVSITTPLTGTNNVSLTVVQ